MQTKNLGYTRENIIDFGIPLGADSTDLSTADAFASELEKIPGVTSVGAIILILQEIMEQLADFIGPERIQQRISHLPILKWVRDFCIRLN